MQHQQSMIIIRPLHADDAPQLLRLFKETIRQVNAADYSPAQIAAWAPDEISEADWAARFSGRFVVVAEAEGDIAGFAELERDGRIDRFYVSATHQGLGVGRALLAALVEHAEQVGIARLSADVSITARPFFERQGFVVVAPQIVTLRGVEFLNYRMARSLN